MKKLLLLLTAMLILSVAEAQPISKEEAQLKAQQFFGKANHIRDGRGNAPRTAPMLTLANNCDQFYIFNDEANGGYVIVSGDERMPDILGYSYDGHFDTENVPCNMEALLEGYAEEVRYVQTHEVQKKRQHAAQKWEIDSIAPMLSTTWDQREPYNNHCPTFSGEHCVTGCVATAMAQILAYHQWPQKTTETIPQYKTSTNRIDIPAIEPTSIDWEKMLPSYNDSVSYTEKQADAVANLMKLCGASVEMDYGLDGSGASAGAGVTDSFIEYFGYNSDDIVGFYKRNFSSYDWDYFIYNELANRRPVYYSASDGGAGHAMVIDGFQGDGNNHFFHVNFGWGGSSDGFFLLDEVQYKYNSYAIAGIQPLKPDSTWAYGVLDDSLLTLYYDNKHESRTGKVIPSFKKSLSDNKKMTKCVIDSSFKDYTPHSLSALFEGCNDLREIVGLGNINTSLMTSMANMFKGCSSLTSLDLSGFNTDNVTSMHYMFRGCSSLTSLDLSGFNTDNVTDMESMFSYCSSLTSLDLSGFNTDNVTDMGGMFDNCSSLTSLDLSGFNTDNVTDMWGMFQGCSSLTSLDVSGFNTENVKDMGSMFSVCSSLTSLDVSGFNTENVIGMRYMFQNCSSLTSLDVSSFKTDKVTNMCGMFRGCTSLTSLDLSRFNTDKVTSMELMFSGCSNLTNLDLSGFNTDKVTNMSSMFMRCWNLSTLYVSEKWNTNNVENADGMFDYCTSLVGGEGTQFSWAHMGIDYAHIDGGLDNPGYLTYKENTNAINTLLSKSSHTKIYDLYGNRHNSLFKGIHIVDGKKMWVK